MTRQSTFVVSVVQRPLTPVLLEWQESRWQGLAMLRLSEKLRREQRRKVSLTLKNSEKDSLYV